MQPNYNAQQHSLFDDEYTNKLISDLTKIEIPNETHAIIPNLFKLNEVYNFITLANPVFPPARQGLSTGTNDTKFEPSPVRWINVR